jgi:hypothetical protein
MRTFKRTELIDHVLENFFELKLRKISPGIDGPFLLVNDIIGTHYYAVPHNTT